jgi:hypothetical protein
MGMRTASMGMMGGLFLVFISHQHLRPHLPLGSGGMGMQSLGGWASFVCACLVSTKFNFPYGRSNGRANDDGRP